MSPHPIFSVSESLFEDWSLRLINSEIKLVKEGERRETEEGFHQVWEAWLGDQKLFWFEYLSQRPENRDVIIIGPLLRREKREVYLVALSELAALGAPALKGL